MGEVVGEVTTITPPPEYPEVGRWQISSGSLAGTGVSIFWKGSESNEITVYNESFVTVGLVKINPDGSTEFLGSTPAGTNIPITFERGIKYGMGEVLPNGEVDIKITIEQQMFTPPPIEVVGEGEVDIKNNNRATDVYAT